jgi:cell division protein FtsN
MLIRFLIVVLAILNVGVALWWMTPRPVAAPTPTRVEPGVASLELLPTPVVPAPAAPAAQPAPSTSEASSAAVAAAGISPPVAAAPVAAVPAPPPATPVATTPAQCLSLGPFAAQTEAQSALSKLGGVAERPRLREVPGKAASGYRVMIPAAATRDEAQATVKRIVEAGFSDYFIIAQGEDANAVALGQYRNREGAERRQATLTAAGFPAKMVANGAETPASWWIDTAVAADSSASVVAQRSGAAQQPSLDCARLR